MTRTQLFRAPRLLSGVAALALAATGFAGLAAADDDDSVIWVSNGDASTDVRVLSLGEGRHEIIIENGEITIDGDAVDIDDGAHVMINDGEVHIIGAHDRVSRHCEQSIVIRNDDDEESRRIVTSGCGDHGARVLRLHDGGDVSVFSSFGELHGLGGLEVLEHLEGLAELEGLETEINVIIERALSIGDGESHIIIRRDGWHDLTDEERREIQDAHREARDAAREAGREARDAAREAGHAARDAGREARRHARTFAFASRHNWDFDLDDITSDAERIGEATEDWPDGEYELRHEDGVTIATGPDGVERRIEGLENFFDNDDDTSRLIIERSED